MGSKHKVAGLIVAGGMGRRMASHTPKQYMNIGEETILEKTIKTFYNNSLIDIVCVVIAREHQEMFKAIAKKYDKLIFCYGGIFRQDSVHLGLERLKEFSPDFVLIHDSVRPFVSKKIISNVVSALNDNNTAVLPAVRVKDTIKSCVDMLINETLPRENLYSAQTPQGFNYGLILNLHDKYKGHDFTDDSLLAEKAGIKVKIVEGDYANYKITTEDDLKFARGTMQKQTRVGNGFDVHQFEAGDGVIMCGIKIAHNKKLKGHSDADCAWHALTDALLGSIGLGDIGEHFPDSDAQWKNVSSSIFLKKAAEEISARNGDITNVDITIICEEPKMKLHKEKMRDMTAKVLNINSSQVNIKATTTEQLGFLGRKEGIAVMVTATVII